MNKSKTAALILSAGSSQRMSSHKALLPFDDKMTFLVKIIKTYSDWGCGKIVVVVNPDLKEKLIKMNPFPETVSFVVNDHPEYERFYSVKLGVEALGSPTFCFLQNVDNPFFDEHILDMIYDHRSTEKYVSPVFKGKGGHPVLMNRKNMITIGGHEENSANLKEILGTMDCYLMEMNDDRVLININTMEEYRRLF